MDRQSPPADLIVIVRSGTASLARALLIASSSALAVFLPPDGLDPSAVAAVISGSCALCPASILLDLSSSFRNMPALKKSVGTSFSGLTATTLPSSTSTSSSSPSRMRSFSSISCGIVTCLFETTFKRKKSRTMHLPKATIGLSCNLIIVQSDGLVKSYFA